MGFASIGHVLNAFSLPATGYAPGNQNTFMLDASASWVAAGDSTLRNRARAAIDSVNSDSTLLVGDSVRSGSLPDSPGDQASRVTALA